MHYLDGAEVRVGDHVLHSNAEAIIESIIEGDEVASWGIEVPGFMILCNQCGRVLIEPGSDDWEDVAFVGRDA